MAQAEEIQSAIETARRTWSPPRVNRIESGSAENGNNPDPDATVFPS